MGLIKNIKADRNSGQLAVNKQRQKDLLNGVRRKESEQKSLDRVTYKIGVQESKQKRYEASNTPKSVNSTKSISVNNVKKIGSDNTFGSNNRNGSKSTGKSKK